MLCRDVILNFVAGITGEIIVLYKPSFPEQRHIGLAYIFCPGLATLHIRRITSTEWLTGALWVPL